MSSTDNYCTPGEVIDPLVKLDEIGLDPFHHPDSIVPAKVKVFRDDLHPLVTSVAPGVILGDGLDYPWDGHGLIYANGPYSDCAPWIYKGAKEGDEVVLHCPAWTSTGWWHNWVTPADVIMFWNKRLRYGDEKHHAKFHSVNVYWGYRPEKFIEVHRGLGWFVRGGS